MECFLSPEGVRGARVKVSPVAPSLLVSHELGLLYIDSCMCVCVGGEGYTSGSCKCQT